MDIPKNIFRAYDIRGRVEDELTPEATFAIGRAFANVAIENGSKAVVVAGDVRLSTPILRRELLAGLTTAGIDCIDIGVVPTPVLYYATHHLKTGTGIMITGSHNPPEYNGLKCMMNGIPYAGDELQELYSFLPEVKDASKPGTVTTDDVLEDYMEEIVSGINLKRKLRVAIDCGNGATSVLVPELFKRLGCEVVPLFAEPDGNFPNHHPDPSMPQNLFHLIEKVEKRKLQLGIAFDGDGDRIGVVTSQGNIMPADTLIAYLCRSVLKENPEAPIIIDVKCGKVTTDAIRGWGGEVVMWKTGHTHIKQKIRELKAPMGGEFSGHICFADRWYGFDDALYSAARLLETLSEDKKSLHLYMKDLPNTFASPELELETTDSEKFKMIEKFAKLGSFGPGKVSNIDGVRVDYIDSWGLLRASNTSPKITMRYELGSRYGREMIKNHFIGEIKRLFPETLISESIIPE